MQCLHVKVTSSSLSFEYLDVYREDGAATDEFVYYTVPPFRLTGSVNPELTRVWASGQATVAVQLSKQRSIGWRQPAVDPESNKPVKLHWLKLADK